MHPSTKLALGMVSEWDGYTPHKWHIYILMEVPRNVMGANMLAGPLSSLPSVCQGCFKSEVLREV
eukprot:10235752-Alexandrium_andersonii.AAC.1